MLIDSHVHLRDFRQSDLETVWNGFQVAHRLGIAGLLEMPNTNPPLISRSHMEQRLDLVEQAQRRLLDRYGTRIHYGMHLGLSSEPEQAREVISLWEEFFPLVAGLKMYAAHSTGKMGICEPSGQGEIYRLLSERQFTGVLALHCETQARIRADLFDPLDPSSHSLARPPEAEIESIAKQIELAQRYQFPGHLHIAHISTPEGVHLVQSAKAGGNRISSGITPHHCLLNTEYQRRLESRQSGLGHLLKVNPPLRDPDRQGKLWQMLLSGEIDWIESDHAPHLPAEKRFSAGQKPGSLASGIPGLPALAKLYRRLAAESLPDGLLARLAYQGVLDTYQLPWELQPPAEETLQNEVGEYAEIDPYRFFPEIWQVSPL